MTDWLTHLVHTQHNTFTNIQRYKYKISKLWEDKSVQYHLALTECLCACILYIVGEVSGTYLSLHGEQDMKG